MSGRRVLISCSSWISRSLIARRGVIAFARPAGWHGRRFMGEGMVVPPDQVSLGVLVAAMD